MVERTGTSPGDGTDGGQAPDGPADDPAAGVDDLGYEEARDELVAIVARLEGGQVGLEESLSLWRRGDALAAHCSAWLDAAEKALAEGEPEA